ncbi:MAG: ExeM/NucH family extracellular endonuclease [Xanthomonadales bacterium]|nr:ExeM/NucH family extracellular endonuclease [Xanthomonadales bacterium]
MSLTLNFNRYLSARLAPLAFILILAAACTKPAEDHSGRVESFPFGACGDDATFISAIQGSAAVSPMLGNAVVVEAVVVGDYQETSTTNPARPELRGFYLQEENADADADDATSEGLFVFDPNKTLELVEGDLVRVSGTVAEFVTNTQIGNVSGVLLCDSGQTVTPAPVDLPVPGIFATVDDYYETVEGMLVNFVDVMTVTEQFELARYGQMVLSEGGALRQYSQGASLPLNQTDFDNHTDANARRSIKLDDFNTQQNIDPVYFPQTGNFALNNFIRSGAAITDLTGVMNYTFDEWTVQALKSSPPSIINPARPTAPPALAGNVTMAALNVLNYFNGDGLGGGFPTSRGADSQAELDRQTAKIVATIVAMDAAVLGLMEIENDGNGANDALGYLVSAVNLAAGPGTYAAVQVGNYGGSDEIKVALLYKPAMLETAGAAQALSSTAFTDPNHTGRQQNRPALAQTFRVIAADNPDRGAAFTSVVLHLKSKGSNCGAGDDDPIQGKCNSTRSKAAMALLDWLTTDPTATLTTIGVADPDVFIVGDLNAYYQEDPLQVFFKAGFGSLVAQSDHTYVFAGNWGSLDYVLASPSLLDQKVSGAVWHINADENSLLDYNDSVKDASEAADEAKPSSQEHYANDAWRSSDHDPVMVGISWGQSKGTE